MNNELEDRVREALNARAQSTTLSVLTVHVSDVGADPTAHREALVVPLARHRAARVGLVVAAAACLLGLILVTNRHEPRQPATPAAPPHWTVAADLAGVFKAPPEAVTPAGQSRDAQRSPNSISLAGVASTTHGIVAVGAEQSADSFVAAVWLSADGATWRRVAHDADAFGELHPAATPGDTVGYAMSSIVEFRGTLVAVGGRLDSHLLQQGETGYPGSTSVVEPVVWTSANGTNWKRQTLPSTPGNNAGIMAVAAGPSGLLAVGSTYQTSTSSAATEVWHSDDALTWTRGKFPLASGPRFDGLSANAIVAFNDQFAAVGTDDGHATAWITRDGSTWTTALLPDGISDDSEVSFARSVATSGGRLIALGSIQSTEPAGVSYSSDTGRITQSGHRDIAVWYSDDGQTWIRPALGELADNQLQIPVSMAAGPHGVVGFVRLFDRDHYVEATIASADGEEWTLSDSALNGPRTDLVATPFGWIGIGSERDVDYSAFGLGSQSAIPAPENASVWVARA